MHEIIEGILNVLDDLAEQVEDLDPRCKDYHYEYESHLRNRIRDLKARLNELNTE